MSVNDKIDQEEWEGELNLSKEITFEDFIKGVNGLCNDLKSRKKNCLHKRILEQRQNV